MNRPPCGRSAVRSILTTCAALAAVLLAAASPADAQAFKDLCTNTVPSRLEVQGDQLLVDGKPRFSVLVSYFDVMRASPATLERDFAFLKQRGVHGIRIFPLWVREPGEPMGQEPEAALLDADGRVRSHERWDHFALALSLAARCGFIVDVTFNREMLDTISEFTVAEYRGDPARTSCTGESATPGRGLSEIACRLRGPAYSHLLLDIQNERNIGAEGMQLSIDELRSIRNAIKRVAPRRLVMTSHGGGDVGSHLEAVKAASLDVVAFHEEQRRRWFEDTAAHIASLKPLGRPIYVQEGARATPPDERFRGSECSSVAIEENPFTKAMLETRRAGAAAWTFHTDAAFRLDTQSFQKELAACPRELEFLNGFARMLGR